jgi:hypothetical protein
MEQDGRQSLHIYAVLVYQTAAGFRVGRIEAERYRIPGQGISQFVAGLGKPLADNPHDFMVRPMRSRPRGESVLDLGIEAFFRRDPALDDVEIYAPQGDRLPYDLECLEGDACAALVHRQEQSASGIANSRLALLEERDTGHVRKVESDCNKCDIFPLAGENTQGFDSRGS